MHTRRSYPFAISFLEAFASPRGKTVLELRPKDVNAFIRSQPGDGASGRVATSAASSFSAFLERQTEERLQNPVRGTKTRPPHTLVETLHGRAGDNP